VIRLRAPDHDGCNQNLGHQIAAFRVEPAMGASPSVYRHRIHIPPPFLLPPIQACPAVLAVVNVAVIHCSPTLLLP
jgi:hypothetical protein